MTIDKEAIACDPVPVRVDGFNPAAYIPHGCMLEHIAQAMHAFNDFLGFVNQQLHSRDMVRLESLLMPANFSSIVSQ